MTLNVIQPFKITMKTRCRRKICDIEGRRHLKLYAYEDMYWKELEISWTLFSSSFFGLLYKLIISEEAGRG